jgi:DNA-binding NarL/FixJ family response regulator
MARPSSQIVLSAEGRRELERLARAPRTQSRYAQRALIVLLAAEGLTNKEIAKR